MVEKLKEMRGIAFGFLVFIAILSFPYVFIMGATWASKSTGAINCHRLGIISPKYSNSTSPLNFQAA